MKATLERPLFTGLDLRRLILPLVIEQFLAVTVGIADTMMVSRAGEAAVSGVSLVDIVVVLLLQVFAALATGGAVITSQYLGSKQGEKADESATQLMLVSGLTGLAMMALTLVFSQGLLSLFFGQIEPAVMAAALIYLRITAMSFPFLAVYNAGAALFRSVGNSKISMRVSIVMNVLNVIGNAICIFGLGMGVAGVAVPSLICRALGAGLILKKAMETKEGAKVSFSKETRLNRGMVGRILHIGVPSAFESSCFQLGRVMVLSMVTAYGTVQITANALAVNVGNFTIVPGQAYILAMITVIGRCVGAEDHAQVVYYVRKLMTQIYVIFFVMCTLTVVALPWILQLYDVSPAAKELATKLVYIHAGFGIFIWPISFVLPSALRAADDVRFTMTLSMASMLLCRVGLSYVFAMQMGMGALGTWSAMIGDWMFRSIGFSWRYLRGGWKNKYVADK